MTPTPNAAEIARYAFDATRGEAFTIAHGAYVTYADHLAAVQAVERAVIERCARIVEDMASQRLLVCPRHDVSFPVFDRQADILRDAAKSIRALDLGASKVGR